MGHQRGVLDQTFDASQAFDEREKPGAFEKQLRSGEIAVKVDRDHAAEAMHLLGGNGVLRVAGEARIDDAPDV